MKEQLTLEILCCYLPYGLKVKTDIWIEEIGSLNGFDSVLNEVRVTLIINRNKKRTEAMTWTPLLKHCKPIFHPLSELEGTEQWNEIVSEHNYPDFGHFERSVLSGHAPHKLILELVKEHFWIYDQSYFEKGLILDINELNK